VKFVNQNLVQGLLVTSPGLLFSLIVTLYFICILILSWSPRLYHVSYNIMIVWLSCFITVASFFLLCLSTL